MSFRHIRNCSAETGGTLYEFALTAFMCVMLLFGVVDIARLVLVYTTVNNAARAGVRYAIVHGSDNSATTSQIQTVVKNYLSAASISTSGATITPSYPSGNSPGSLVKVTVSYPYKPLTSYFPLNVTLTSTSEGAITF